MVRVENNLHRSNPTLHERALRKAGFANRDRIIENLNQIYTNGPRGFERPDFIIHEMVSSGILRKEVLAQHPNGVVDSFEELRTFVSLTVTPAKIRESNISFNEELLFSDRSRTLYLMSSTAVDLVSSGSLLAGKVVYWALGVAAVAGITDIMINDYVAAFTGGTALLGVLGAKFADRINPNTGTHTLAVVAKKFAPLAGASAFGYLTYLFHESNNQAGNLSRYFGLWGTTGLIAGTVWLTMNYVIKELKAFDRSYGGQLNPGSKSGMKSVLLAATAATAAEAQYMTARLMMLISSVWFVGRNISDSTNNVGLIPLVIPLLSFAATWGLRRQGTEFIDPSTYRSLKRHATIFTPLYGLGAGLATAVGIAAEHHQPEILQAYAIVWSAMLYYFVSELHTSGSSTNTNLGLARGYKSSNTPVISEEKINRLTKDVVSLFKRADTGLKESSLGLLFNMLNGMGGQPTFSFYDRPMFVPGNAGEFKKRQTYVSDEIGGLQREIFGLLHDRVATHFDSERRGTASQGNTIRERYAILIEDLNRTADFFTQTLIPELQTELLAGSKGKVGAAGGGNKRFPSAAGAFDEVEREYIRANLNRLQAVAAGFQERAARLAAKLAANQDSATDFRREWSDVLRDFDPSYVTITPIGRKAFAGDCFDIQKGQNVNAMDMFRAQTTYLLEEKEWNGQGHPTTYIVGGRWSKVVNPYFKYDAEPGTIEAARHLWVRSESLLVEMQKGNQSTSPIIKEINNSPSAAEGFAQRNVPITIKHNNQNLTITEYYFAARTGENQDPMPAIKGYLLRGPEANETEIAAIPGNLQFQRVVHVPAWDYYTIADKNDVIFHVERSLTALEEARQLNEVYLQATYMVPWGKADVSDPVVKNAKVIDGNISLTFNGRLIPYQFERDAIRDFLAKQGKRFIEALPLHSAVATRINGETTAFSLIYQGTAPVARAHLTRRLEGLGLQKVDKAEFAVFGSRQDELWGAMQKAGYLDKDGNIQPKFTGKVSDFKLAVQLTPNEVQQLFAIAQRPTIDLPLTITKNGGAITGAAITIKGNSVNLEEFAASETSLVDALKQFNLPDGDSQVTLAVALDRSKAEVFGLVLSFNNQTRSFNKLAESVEVAIPAATYFPKYLDQLGLPDNATTIIPATNYPGIAGFSWFIKYVPENGQTTFMQGQGNRMTWRDQLSKARGH